MDPYPFFTGPIKDPGPHKSDKDPDPHQADTDPHHCSGGKISDIIPYIVHTFPSTLF